jgi:translation initiation factor IF-2
VGAGLECGVGVDGYNDWQEGDIIFAFNKVAKRRTLEDASVTVTAAVAANSNRQ